ncbi:hypothetical protein KSF78_0003849 [Schistosoma japonicum]|nr:hypothetical protein KSF78_0003849 [Schistosoma japonicum]
MPPRTNHYFLVLLVHHSFASVNKHLN